MAGNPRVAFKVRGFITGAILVLAAPPVTAGVVDLIHRDGFEDSAFTASTAFRISDIDLRDPHTYFEFLGCRDVTDASFGGLSFNGELQASRETDGDGDGFLDSSEVLVFRPLEQGDGGAGALEAASAQCSAPAASTTCASVPGSLPLFLSTYGSFGSGAACLAPLAGTERPYMPAITSSPAPCFLAGESTLLFDFAGIPLSLIGVDIAATYVGDPATQLVNGLLRGFLTEATANATIIPADFPLIGGQALSNVLPGGDPPGSAINCAAHSDKDVRDGVMGWWIYFNFTAVPVPYTD